MDKLLRTGRYCFAIALAAFGIQHFIYARFAAGLGPPWVLGRPLWACLMGFVLAASGLAIATGRASRFAAAILGTILFLYFLFLYAPGIVAHLHDPARWTSGAEIVCLSGAAWVLAATRGTGRVRGGIVTALGHLLYALPVTVFGVQHLLYGPFVATLVPAWIPGRLFFAYAVGIAFIATTISLVTSIKARLAATLLGIMFFAWVFIVHLPRVSSALRNGNEWTSLFVALAMGGGAWVIAATVRE